MFYFITIFLLFALFFRFIPQLRIGGLNDWTQSLGYAIKVGAGFYFIYIYTAVYGSGALSADAGAFMEESLILNDVFWNAPADYFRLLIGWDPNDGLMFKHLAETSHWDAGAQAILSDNRNILRVHSIIHFFSFNSVDIHLLVMCAISLIGVKQFYLAIKDHTKIADKYVYAAILVFPSVLFWTSSILKEPLMFLGLGLFVRGILQMNIGRIKRTFILTSGLLLLLAFKPYVLICLVPSLVFYWVYTLIPKWKVAISIGIISLIGISATFLMPRQRSKFVHILSYKQYDFNNVGKGGLHALSDSCFYFFEQEQIDDLIIVGDSVWIDKTINAHVIYPGSIDGPIPKTLIPSGQKWLIYFRNDKSDGFIETTMINDSFKRLIFNIPEALLNSLLRPYPTDPGSWLKYPAMIEVFVLMLFMLIAILKMRPLTEFEKGLVWSALLFTFILALMIGWVTPVLGAIVRYRIPAFIALLVVGMTLIDPTKLRLKRQ
jgi:hypothetical protein